MNSLRIKFWIVLLIVTLFCTMPQLAWAQGEEVPAEGTPHKSYLMWMIESSGPVGAVLLVMSFISVALITSSMLDLRRSKIVPPDLVAQFEQLLANKQYQAAYTLAHEEDKSFLGKVLAAGLSRLGGGFHEATEAMQRVGDDESMRIEHRISWLAIIGTAAPLLGLLGTVEGIIASFRVIATSDTQPKPSLLAEGISTSLFNTFEGLFVAIIAMVAFMLLKNQAARMVLEVELATDKLMYRFKNLGAGNRSVNPTTPS